MFKRFRFILIAFAFLMLVLASLACEPSPAVIAATATPKPERPYIVVLSERHWYACANYKGLDNGNLQLTNCTDRWSKNVGNPLIINPIGVTIESRDATIHW